MVLKVVVDNELAFDFEAAVKDIVQKSEDSAAVELSRNYQALIDNFLAYKNPDRNEALIKRILEFCKEAKSKLKLDDLLKQQIQNFFGCCEVEIETSRLMTSLVYFVQSVDYIEGLSGELRVMALEQPGGVLSTFYASIQRDGDFYTSFCHIINRKYDGKFRTLEDRAWCNFMSHAVGIFILQMFFSIEQHAFLADYYCKEQNLTKLNEHLKSGFLVYKQMKSQLLGRENFIDRLIETMTWYEEVDPRTLLHWKTTLSELNLPELNEQNYLQASSTNKNVYRLTSLHIATFQADFEFIKATLRKSLCDLNAEDCEGFTPLHCAVLVGDAVVKELQSYKNIAVNAQSKAGFTALHIAVIVNSIEVVKTLLKSPKTDVNAASMDGWTPLHIAVSLRRVEIVAELLKMESLNINAKMFGLVAPLHIAARLDDQNLIEMLLKKCAEVMAVTENGLTAQKIAEKFNCFVALKLIKNSIKKSATLKTSAAYATSLSTNTFENLTRTQADSAAEIERSEKGTEGAYQKAETQRSKCGIKTALLQQFELECNDDTTSISQLFQAVLKGELERIKLLVANGADVTSNHESGKNIFYFVLASGDLEVFKYFLEEHKTMLLTLKTSLEILLFEAAKFDAFHILKYLIEEQALNPQLKNEMNKTLLCASIAGGNFEIVKYLIEDQGVPVTSTSENCPLCSAIAVDNLPMVEYFLERGLNILGVSDEQRPILVAAQKSSLEIFLYLSERGASMDVRNNDKGVFDYAAIGGNSKILRYLVKEKNYELRSRIPSSGLTAFFQATRAGTLDDIKYFVEEEKLSVFDKGPLKGTILHEAAYNRHLDVIKYFVEQHDLNAKARDDNGFVPLFYAVQDNNLVAVEYFIVDRKLGIHLKDKNNRSVLHIAALNGHLEMVRYLVEERKANLNVKDNDGLTPLLLAAQSSPSSSILLVLNYLLNRGSDINCLTAGQANILHLAARLGDIKLIKSLVEENGVDTSTVDAKGQNPLFYAAFAGHLEAVKYFVESRKVDVHLKDSKRQTVLEAVSSIWVSSAQVRNNFHILEYLLKRDSEYIVHTAARLGNVEIIKFLVEDKNMNINSKDKACNTPIFCAASANKLDAVKYFVDSKKVDLKHVDIYGKNVFFYALYWNHSDLVKYLERELKGRK